VYQLEYFKHLITGYRIHQKLSLFKDKIHHAKLVRKIYVRFANNLLSLIKQRNLINEILTFIRHTKAKSTHGAANHCIILTLDTCNNNSNVFRNDSILFSRCRYWVSLPVLTWQNFSNINSLNIRWANHAFISHMKNRKSSLLGTVATISAERNEKARRHANPTARNVLNCDMTAARIALN